MRTVKKDGVGSFYNVRTQSNTEQKTSQKRKKGKTKSKTSFEQDIRETDLDTGEVSELKTRQIDKAKTKRSGKVKKKEKFKQTLKVKDKDDKLLLKQVDRKGGSRVRVTKRGKASGYGK